MMLNSSDPFTFPIIDPAFLTTDFDAFAMLSAVRAARRFVTATPWSDFIVAPYGDVSTAETDEEIVAAVRKNIVTIWHPTRTARMSPADAAWGVVDPHLRVKGVHGLRVVDASVIVSDQLCLKLRADADDVPAASDACWASNRSYLHSG